MTSKIIVDGPQHDFSAAHFIIGHEKCSRLHGHNYHLRVEITGDLDENGFVIDFCIVKDAIRSITRQLDHLTLIPGTSAFINIRSLDDNVNFSFEGMDGEKKLYSIPKGDVNILPLPAISSELLAKFIHDELKKVFPGHGLRVRIGETASSFAEYAGDA